MNYRTFINAMFTENPIAVALILTGGALLAIMIIIKIVMWKRELVLKIIKWLVEVSRFSVREFKERFYK